MNDSMITSGLFELQDEGYRVFQAKLMPNISCDRIIGVRTPDLRSYAKKIFQMPEAKEFIQKLPHDYYEENNLHGVLLSLLYPEDIETLQDAIVAAANEALRKADEANAELMGKMTGGLGGFPF